MAPFLPRFSPVITPSSPVSSPSSCSDFRPRLPTFRPVEQGSGEEIGREDGPECVQVLVALDPMRFRCWWCLAIASESPGFDPAVTDGLPAMLEAQMLFHCQAILWNMAVNGGCLFRSLTIPQGHSREILWRMDYSRSSVGWSVKETWVWRSHLSEIMSLKTIHWKRVPREWELLQSHKFI